MRSGRLRHYVTIEQSSTVADSYGEPDESWSVFAVVWTDIQPVKAEERFSVGQEKARVTHQIRMRYLAGVTHKMRVNYDSRIFNIVSIVNRDERNKELVMLAEENVS